MTALILGFDGQLARHLVRRLPSATAWGRKQLDLADTARILPAVRELRPSAIINAAAFTAVDRAESEPVAAWRLNADAPAALAESARELNVPLVHISTDYVFDGNATTDYLAEDPVCPINNYGLSKLAGELAVRMIAPKHWIFRTSWVFSEYGTNFVRTMRRLATERPLLRVVDDQVGRPTYAGDLAECIARCLEGLSGAVEPLPWGLHHVGAGPVVSWKQFAERIVDGAVPVEGIPTSSYPTPARRPARSVLAADPRHAEWLTASFNWEKGLCQTCRALASIAESY